MESSVDVAVSPCSIEARIPAAQPDGAKAEPAAAAAGATSAWAGAFHGTVDIVPSFGFDTGSPREDSRASCLARDILSCCGTHVLEEAHCSLSTLKAEQDFGMSDGCKSIKIEEHFPSLLCEVYSIRTRARKLLGSEVQRNSDQLELESAELGGFVLC
ncbi:hypothetical protein EK904_004489 [Melospiza melodia maxima]|nr:hypothetical protein EK904_004489 [Melospiza melodia maxima]